MGAHVHGGHDLGRWGEDRAAAFLRARGWTILARNYRWGRREVDLVVRRGRLVAFVEVKTRSGTGFGPPQEAITRLKRREVEAVAADFLRRRPQGEVDVRFDAVAVVAPRGDRAGARVEHLEDAWRPEWP